MLFLLHQPNCTFNLMQSVIILTCYCVIITWIGGGDVVFGVDGGIVVVRHATGGKIECDNSDSIKSHVGTDFYVLKRIPTVVDSEIIGSTVRVGCASISGCSSGTSGWTASRASCGCRRSWGLNRSYG